VARGVLRIASTNQPTNQPTNQQKLNLKNIPTLDLGSNKAPSLLKIAKAPRAALKNGKKVQAMLQFKPGAFSILGSSMIDESTPLELPIIRSPNYGTITEGTGSITLKDGAEQSTSGWGLSELAYKSFSIVKVSEGLYDIQLNAGRGSGPYSYEILAKTRVSGPSVLKKGSTLSGDVSTDSLYERTHDSLGQPNQYFFESGTLSAQINNDTVTVSLSGAYASRVKAYICAYRCEEYTDSNKQLINGEISFTSPLNLEDIKLQLRSDNDFIGSNSVFQTSNLAIDDFGLGKPWSIAIEGNSDDCTLPGIVRGTGSKDLAGTLQAMGLPDGDYAVSAGYDEYSEYKATVNITVGHQLTLETDKDTFAPVKSESIEFDIGGAPSCPEWTVKVAAKDINGETCNWSGKGTGNKKVSWNGICENGNMVADGEYRAEIDNGYSVPDSAPFQVASCSIPATLSKTCKALFCRTDVSYYRVDLECKQCPGGSTATASNNTCVCNRSDQNFNQSTGKCETISAPPPPPNPTAPPGPTPTIPVINPPKGSPPDPLNFRGCPVQTADGANTGLSLTGATNFDSKGGDLTLFFSGPKFISNIYPQTSLSNGMGIHPPPNLNGLLKKPQVSNQLYSYMLGDQVSFFAHKEAIAEAIKTSENTQEKRRLQEFSNLMRGRDLVIGIDVNSAISMKEQDYGDNKLIKEKATLNFMNGQYKIDLNLEFIVEGKYTRNNRTEYKLDWKSVKCEK
jgi:hypothetical protein